MKKSKKIALAGISAAFATIFLALGNYVTLFDYSFYLLASLCLMVPFVTDEVIWGILSFLVATLLGIAFAPNIMAMFAFFVFFGPYAIITSIVEMKNVKTIIKYVVKNVFYCISIILMYFFSTIFVEINMWNLPLWLLFVGALLLMNVYDYMVVIIIKRMKVIVMKILNKS